MSCNPFVSITPSDVPDLNHLELTLAGPMVSCKNCRYVFLSSKLRLLARRPDSSMMFTNVALLLPRRPFLCRCR